MKITIKNQEKDYKLSEGQIWKTENGYRLVVEIGEYYSLIDLTYFNEAYSNITIGASILDFYTDAQLVEGELIIRE